MIEESGTAPRSGPNLERRRPHREVVTPERVLETAGGLSARDALRLTPIQQAGYHLAAWLGLCLAGATLLVGLDWLLSAPRPPSAVELMDPAAARAAIENYRALNEAALDRTARLFDTLVVKELMPLFAAVVGYLFGAREGRPAGGRS